MLSGTAIGFICVLAILLASFFIAMLDRQEKKKGNRSKALSRLSLILFLAAFIGGVVVTLVAGVRPRAGDSPMTGRPMGPMSGGGSIGRIDEEELKRLEEIRQKDPKDVRSRERLGHLYLQQQDFEKVVEVSHETLKLDPKSAESRVHMGMVLFAMQQIDPAIAQFDKALENDSNNTEALLFKGVVLFQGKDDLKGAKQSWERFMKISKPDDPGRVRVEMFLENINSLK